VPEGAKEQQGREVGGIRTRAAARLAWSLYGIVICLAIIWSAGAKLLSESISKGALQTAADALLSLVAPVVFAVVAALILSRQPRNTIGWLMMMPVATALVGEPLENHLAHLKASSPPAPTIPLLLMVWFDSWIWVPLIFSLLLILLLFPNGRPPTSRWRWVSVLAVVWAVLIVLLATFISRIRASGIVLENPLGVLDKDTAQLLAGVWIAGLAALFVVCAVGLFVRYRRADDTEREQIKWLLYACAVFVIVYVIIGGVGGLGGTNSIGGHIWEVFFGLSLVTIPAAIGIAILRYRLYDIDIIINRTLVYGPLTATLALIYVGGVVSLQALFRVLTGQESTLAVVASTLAIAALFNPLRSWVQAFVDRRFYRKKYDARRTLEAFSAKLRNETNLEALNRELVEVVRETMQPAHVTLWLRPHTAQWGSEEPE
jgi:hypothetical protein